MTYQENLIKTAEDISLVIFNCQYSRMTTNSKQECTELAEYCLNKQAEAYRKGWSASCGVSEIENELKKLGLIP